MHHLLCLATASDFSRKSTEVHGWFGVFSGLELFRYWLQRILHDNLAIWSSHVACNLACEKRLNEEISAAHNKVVGLPNQFLIF